MDKDYLQLALAKFNIEKHQWYGFRKDYTGSKRMSYANLIINDSTATMPTETEVNNKIAELKAADASKITDKQSAITKITTAASLTDAEKKALFGE